MIAPILPEFMALYPKLSVRIHLINQVVDLVEEGYDLAIRLAAQLTDSTMVTSQLGQSHTIICAAPEYCERHDEPLTPEELLTHTCVLFGDEATAQWYFNNGSKPPKAIKVNGRLSANSIEAVHQVVLGGAGIGLLPEFIVQEDLQAGRLKPLLTEYETTSEFIYLVYPQRKLVATKIRCFIDFCKARIDQ